MMTQHSGPEGGEGDIPVDRFVIGGLQPGLLVKPEVMDRVERDLFINELAREYLDVKHEERFHPAYSIQSALEDETPEIPKNQLILQTAYQAVFNLAYNLGDAIGRSIDEDKKQGFQLDPVVINEMLVLVACNVSEHYEVEEHQEQVLQAMTASEGTVQEIIFNFYLGLNRKAANIPIDVETGLYLMDFIAKRADGIPPIDEEAEVVDLDGSLFGAGGVPIKLGLKYAGGKKKKALLQKKPDIRGAFEKRIQEVQDVLLQRVPEEHRHLIIEKMAELSVGFEGLLEVVVTPDKLFSNILVSAVKQIVGYGGINLYDVPGLADGEQLSEEIQPDVLANIDENLESICCRLRKLKDLFLMNSGEFYRIANKRYPFFAFAEIDQVDLSTLEGVVRFILVLTYWQETPVDMFTQRVAAIAKHAGESAYLESMGITPHAMMGTTRVSVGSGDDQHSFPLSSWVFNGSTENN